MKQHIIRKNKLSNFNGFWVCFVKLPMRVEMGRLVKNRIVHILPDGCFLICDPWNIFLDHLFSFWKIVRSPNKFTNPHVNGRKTLIYNNNISIPYRLLIPHFLPDGSLVFSFGKLGRPRGMTLGTGLLFSFLVSVIIIL
ncbi:hypothetical protein ACJX0J_009790 [Zea mays]